MKSSTILKTGIIGTVLSAICCFTPILTTILVAVGLSAWIGYLDLALLPALIMFAGLMVYGLVLNKGTAQNS